MNDNYEEQIGDMEDLDRMALLKGKMLFRCRRCNTDFKSLEDWATHSLNEHDDDCLLECIPLN